MGFSFLLLDRLVIKPVGPRMIGAQNLVNPNALGEITDLSVVRRLTEL
jgi:hypothetical protein